MSRILASARQLAIRIHTIHLSRGMNQPRESGGSAHGFSHVFERLVVRQEPSAASATARQLKLMSDASGGRACAAQNDRDEVACVAENAALITDR